MLLSVTGFDSAKTVQIRIYNVTTTTETVAWTTTGVSERANGEGKSTYYYDYALTAGQEYIVDWKDNSAPIRTAQESISKMQSYIDAKLSDRPTLAGIEATTILAKEATLTNGTYGLSALNADLDALLTRATELRLAELDPANIPTDIANVKADTASILDDTGTSGVVIPQVQADKVWSTTTRALTDKADFALSSAGVQAIWDKLTSGLTTVGSIGKKLTDWVLGTDSKVILSSDAQIGVTIPTVTSTGTVTGNVNGTIGSLAAQAKLDVNAEVDTALNTAIPVSPTADSINERVKAIDDLTQAGGAGDLAAILTALTVETLTVVTDINNSSLQFKTNLSSSVNDFYKGMWIVPTTGALIGAAPRKVSTYNGSTKLLTLTSGYTSTPADGVVFAIISN